MKAFILTLLLLVIPPCLRASSPHPMMVEPVRLVFREASPAESLEFLRRKGTEFLRKALPANLRSSVLIFEYRFDPSKHRKPVVYDRDNVLYGDALKEVCDQLGLAFEIQSIGRIAILDAPIEGAP